MNKMIYRVTSFILVITMLAGNHMNARAAGKVYYVATTGSDANPGTISAPFRTFAKGISKLAPGDELQIFGGRYTQQVIIQKSGTANSPITIKPVAGQQVVIDGAMVRKRGFLVEGSYITLENFEVKRGLEICVDVTGTFIAVRNFLIHHCKKTGARIKGQNVTLEGSTFHDNVLENAGGINTTSGWGQAIHVGMGGQSVTLQNNIVYNNWGEGIGIGEGKQVNIYNNLVHDNYSSNIYIDNSMDIDVENNFTYSIDPNHFRSGKPANCISMAEESIGNWGAQLARIRIVNNIAAFCKRGIGYTYAEVTDGGMDTVLIAYNTIWGSTDTSIFVLNQTAKTRNSVIANNIVQQPNGNLANIQPTSGISVHHNFWVSPVKMLKNASGPGDRTGDVKLSAAPGFVPGSYSLRSNSPAIGGAVALDVTDDFAHNSRGPSYDMGAFQYTNIDYPTSEVSYDDQNLNFIYSSGWQGIVSTEAFDGSYNLTTEDGASVTLPFIGQSFSIIYKAGQVFSKFDVYIDGKLVNTLNEKSAKAVNQKRWDYPSQLILGAHTLKLVFKVTDSTVNRGSLDAVVIR